MKELLDTVLLKSSSLKLSNPNSFKSKSLLKKSIKSENDEDGQ